MREIESYRNCLSSKNHDYIGLILEDFKRVEDYIKIIDDDDKAPWIRDKYYELLKINYTPAINKSIKVLRRCTAESIKENYNNLVHFYKDICSLTDETIELLLHKTPYSEYLRKERSKTHLKRIFSTFKDNEKESLVGESGACRVDFTQGFYSVYFTKNCSLEDVEWYLEKHLKKELRPNSAIKNHRKNTKSLREKAFVGILTSYEEKPSNIFKFLNQYFGEHGLVEYPDIKRYRNRLVKDDWFKKAYIETAEIDSTNEAQRVIKSYMKKAEEFNKKYGRNINIKANLKRTTIPYCILKLRFDRSDSLFHVEAA